MEIANSTLLSSLRPYSHEIRKPSQGKGGKSPIERYFYFIATVLLLVLTVVGFRLFYFHGQARFTSKKALQGCRIRMQLDLEVRVWVKQDSLGGDGSDGQHEWQSFASSRVELPDTVFDMEANETRTFPFSLDARIPDTRPSDKKSLLGRMMQDDESKAWAMTPEELLSKYRTRWSLGAAVSGPPEEITASLILPVAKGDASR